MNKKELFIKWCEDALINCPMSEDVVTYFEALKISDVKADKNKLTENGKSVLLFMRENKETYKNLFQAKTVGVGMGISSKTVSGACRKLVSDGYLEKLGENPVSYTLTDFGVNADIEQ